MFLYNYLYVCAYMFINTVFCIYMFNIYQPIYLSINLSIYAVYYLKP